MITTSSLTSTSLEIGVTSNYTLQFIPLNNLILSQSVINIVFPSSYSNSLNTVTCLPATCTNSALTISFSNIPVTPNNSITLTLLNIVNPLKLGIISSLIISTLYFSTDSASIVDQVSSGLTLNLLSRKLQSSNILISSSSNVVYNFPT